MTVLVVVLAALVVAEAVALVLVTRSLRLSRARYAELEAAIVEPAAPSSAGATAAAFAGNAIRMLTTGATRLRRGGFGELLTGSLEDLQRWGREDRARIVRVAGPDGTVTVVFTDIVDSTARNEELGDARWLEVLQAHERLVTSCVADAGGHVVKNQGDGFMIVFGSPGSAVDSAVALQRTLAGRPPRTLRRSPIELRIGMHAGRVEARSDDFFGLAVAVAARVAGLADGGQVLVSDAVAQALHDDAPPLTDLGDQTLKGVSGAVRVHDVQWR